MARSRNIKPGLYKNEDLAECSIWARYIFPGLWMLADREGRLQDRPKRIKGELLPYDAHDVEPLLKELAEKRDSEGVPFIVRYQIDGVRYIQISKFSAHQSPHYTEKKSVIKPPPLPESGGGSSTQNSGSDPPIKKGSKPPDSLIPDSLIPDSGKERSADAPHWLPPEWAEFEKHRSEKRAKLTPTARAGCIKKLERWRTQGHDIAEILRHSIDNGYTGLFLPDARNGNGKRPDAARDGTWTERERAAARRAILHPPGEAERDITGDSERVD